MSAFNPEALRALAAAAEKDGQHIYTHWRDSNAAKANEAWHKAASPELFVGLLDRIAELEAQLVQPSRAQIDEWLKVHKLMTIDPDVWQAARQVQVPAISEAAKAFERARHAATGQQARKGMPTEEVSFWMEKLHKCASEAAEDCARAKQATPRGTGLQSIQATLDGIHDIQHRLRTLDSMLTAARQEKQQNRNPEPRH